MSESQTIPIRQPTAWPDPGRELGLPPGNPYKRVCSGRRQRASLPRPV